MGTPKYAERVVRVETRLDTFLDKQFPDFQKTVAKGFEDLTEKIEKISPNGQTPRLIKMGKRLGDDEDVEIIASMVESHKRWHWLLSPVRSVQGYIANAIIYIGAGILLAGAHSIIKAKYPFIP